MTIAIGTDIIEIERLQSVLERQGDKFVKRILTLGEQQEYKRLTTDENQLHFLAKRWCAKEAIAKALGTGIAKGVGWQVMEIQHNEAGAPIVELRNEAAEQLKQLGGSRVLISISDERHYATATCVIS